MEEKKQQPVRVRIEAPATEKVEKKGEKKSLSPLFYVLLFFSYIFSLMSLYLSFVL